MEEKKYNYGIIGSGPAGNTAAILAAQKGYSVVMFEKNILGGVCLNNGCIPTKTILHSVELYHEAKNSAEIGILADDIKLDIKKVMERKNKVIETLRHGLEQSIKNLKIEYVQAEAKVIADNIIEADGKTYNLDKIIVATGSTPKCLKGHEFDHKFIVDSDDLFNLTEIPKKIVIIGAGAEGIEWSRIFNAMGTEVHIVEVAPHLLPVADIEISKRIERTFKQRGIKMYLSTFVENINEGKVHLSNGEVLEPDFTLVAIGRNISRPEINGKVTYLGDTCGQLMLATFAMYQARALVSDVLFDNVFVPSVVYGTPEIAWVGATEQDLPPDSYEKVLYPLTALGKAYCDNATEGFIKLLSYDDHLIGVHIMGKEASALIQQFTIAMQNNIKVSELKKVCFAHPTYSEAVYESIMRL